MTDSAAERPVPTVEVRVHLRDTLSGEDGWDVYQMEAARAEDPDDPEGWYWTDGNAACDCERLRRLHAVLGRPDPHIPCGDTRVVIVEATVSGMPRDSWRDAEPRLPAPHGTAGREPGEDDAE